LAADKSEERAYVGWTLYEGGKKERGKFKNLKLSNGTNSEFADKEKPRKETGER